MDNKKSLMALVLVALVGIIGGTFAYFTSSAKLTNEFTTGIYSTSVTEEFTSPSNWTPGTTTPKKVNVTNNGNVDVAVRASYIESWTAKNGTDLGLTRDGENVAQFIINSDWEKGEDGYYYYKDILSNGDTSTDFISAVTFNPDFELKEGVDIQCTTVEDAGKTTVNCVNLTTGYLDATYTLEITIETIQADQKWAYTSATPTTVSYKEGDEITIAGETFNVIKDNGDTVTMLAQFNLDSTYRQSETRNDVTFSDNNGWEYTTGPKEIDIQQYDGNAKTYVNNYVTYLKGETGDSTITGTLITLAELKELGCTISEDYAFADGLTCANSDNAKWLVNGQYWWIRSILLYDDFGVWGMDISGALFYDYYMNANGVRPVITISKSAI